MRVLLALLLFTSPVLAASTQMGVVYGCSSATLRRVIVPDDDKQLTTQNWISPGECLLIIPRTDNISADILKATGKQTSFPQAALPSGEVILADPLIDSVPGVVLSPLPALPAPDLTLQSVAP